MNVKFAAVDGSHLKVGLYGSLNEHIDDVFRNEVFFSEVERIIPSKSLPGMYYIVSQGKKFTVQEVRK